MMVMHSVPAVPAPWTGPLFTSDGTTWGEDLSKGERKTGLPSQDPLAAELAGLGWVQGGISTALELSGQPGWFSRFCFPAPPS